MILPAQDILRLNILDPCAPRTIMRGVSYGLGPASYDLRIAADIVLLPGSSVLVDAVEHFNMPNDVQGHLYIKSTWARLHIRQAGTLIDPGWRGTLRLELDMIDINLIPNNLTELPTTPTRGPITIPAGTGVVMVEFVYLREPTEQPYSGKYQDQGSNQNAIFECEPP